MSVQEIFVSFDGPFSWFEGNDLAHVSEQSTGIIKGVYLWTVKLDQGELVFYVGQTGRSFSLRMLEHFREHMSGGYSLYEPEEFSQGRKVLLWPGRFGPDRELSTSVFIDEFSQLSSAIVDLAKLYRFFVAPLDCDKRFRERIEAGISEHLHKQPGIVGEFQDTGVLYRSRLENEEPVQVRIQCEENLVGIPEMLWI